MLIAMIAAQARNRCIGRNNRMPWHLPEDLRYFKAQTLGKPIIMGRSTFLSLGRPLPGRLNIVLTRSSDFQADGVQVAHSLEQGLEIARREAEAKGIDELMVIGGADIYRQALPLAERIYLTEIDRHFEGDSFFPELSPADWEELERTDAVSDAAERLVYSHRTLQRRH